MSEHGYAGNPLMNENERLKEQLAQARQQIIEQRQELAFEQDVVKGYGEDLKSLMKTNDQLQQQISELKDRLDRANDLVKEWKKVGAEANRVTDRAHDKIAQLQAENARLKKIEEAVIRQGHGANKEHCCVSAEYGDCEICEAYQEQVSLGSL